MAWRKRVSEDRMQEVIDDYNYKQLEPQQKLQRITGIRELRYWNALVPISATYDPGLRVNIKEAERYVKSKCDTMKYVYKIDLRGNGLSSKDADAILGIVNCLTNRPPKLTVDLSHNKFSYSCIDFIKTLLHDENIEYVNIYANPLSGQVEYVVIRDFNIDELKKLIFVPHGSRLVNNIEYVLPDEEKRAISIQTHREYYKIENLNN
jgi:hypothetical protein